VVTETSESTTTQHKRPKRDFYCRILCGIAAGIILFFETSRVSHPWILAEGAVLIQLCDCWPIFTRRHGRLFCVRLPSTGGRALQWVPDRVKRCRDFLLIGFGYAAGSDPLPGFTVATIFAIFLAYLRAEEKSPGAHQNFARPMAKQQQLWPRSLLSPSLVYCPRRDGWRVPMFALMAEIIASCIVTLVRRV